MFKNVKRGEGIKLLKNFFINNFSILMKDTQNYLVLNSLLNSFDKSRERSFINDNKIQLSLSEKQFNQFIDEEIPKN